MNKQTISNMIMQTTNANWHQTLFDIAS